LYSNILYFDLSLNDHVKFSQAKKKVFFMHFEPRSGVKLTSDKRFCTPQTAA